MRLLKLNASKELRRAAEFGVAGIPALPWLPRGRRGAHTAGANNTR